MRGNREARGRKKETKIKTKPTQNRYTHPLTKKKPKHGIYIMCIFSLKLPLAQTWKQISQTEANALQ